MVDRACPAVIYSWSRRAQSERMGLDLGLGSSGESKLSACCGVWSGKCVPHNCVRAGAQSECAEAVVFGMRRRVVLAGCRSVGSGQRTQKQRQWSNHVQQSEGGSTSGPDAIVHFCSVGRL